MDQEKATLPILPAQRWAGVCAPMKRPKEIACFSYNAAHEYRPDASGLRYYYPPRLGADLCKGFESFEKLDDTPDDHLDSLLKTIMEVEREKGEKVDVDVVTWRGMMTKLLASPFSDRDGFEMNATFYQGREEQIVNNAAQYCSVVQTGIGDTSLIIGGEVDAGNSPPPPTTQTNWVELKTSLDPSSPRDLAAFERKLLKFWLQSFLLGVPKIIVGFRSANGQLRRLEELETAKIPGIVKKRGGWDGNVAVNFGAEVMRFLKGVVVSEGVWRVRRREKGGMLEVFKIEEVGHGGILSEEFINWRIKLALKGDGGGEGQSDVQSDGA